MRYAIFVETLPYRFYNILMLAFVFISALSLLEFGPMHTAPIRAYEKGQVTNPKTDSTLMNQENSFMMPKEDTSYSIVNTLVQIGVLTLVSIVGFYVTSSKHL